jgi:hypothetical protein
MDGDDQRILKLIEGQARIEAQLVQFTKDMAEICAFKDELLATRQEFQDYKANRQYLPDRIISVESRTNLLESNYCILKTQVDNTSTEVGSLKQWANKANGLQLGLQALILIVAAFGPFLIWWLH